MKKGSAKSIRTALKNIAAKENIDFQIIITRYFHERLLFRVANSQYADKFFLKGGALLYAIEGLHIRPTLDIDLLAKKISNDKEQLKQIFRTICSLKSDEDCVVFDIGKMETENIIEEDKYNGIRVLVDAMLDTIKQRLQIDIGFSDIITPAPVNLIYPVLLDELTKPEIQAYSIETIIAEKFHAMITLGTFNSRMKDFYDVYILLKNNDIKDMNLKEAILQTFKNRKTDFVKEHELFSENFHLNQNRQMLWSAFLHKMKITENLDFSFVINNIMQRLYPIYSTYNK